MSTNVQNVQFTELETNRWPQFTHMKDAGHTDIEIAITWHLKCAKQVQRLKKKAKLNGAYREWSNDKTSWIGEEFKEIHGTIKKKKRALPLTYVTMAKLYAKTILTQIESKVTETITEKREINLNVYSDDEKSILDKAARLLDSKVKGESKSIH